MSSGAQTILLSRWAWGANQQSSLSASSFKNCPVLRRPMPGSVAWRSEELPLEPALEPRVKLKDGSDLPTASHPFLLGRLSINR